MSLLEVTQPALVLGSTSPRPLALEADTDFDIVQRSSGGGIVWLDPVESTWLDVFVPRDDALWHRDVALSFEWLGNVIAEAFRSLGATAYTHTGAFKPGSHGGLICFGSLGHGEVVATINGEARKLVGISQRRTRLGSRFQCVWYRHFTLGAIARLATADAFETSAVATATESACGWANLGPSFDGVASTDVVRRVISHLTGA